MTTNTNVISDKSVQGVILAGTHRWNPTSFEVVLPRPMMHVAHTPVMAYGLHWFYGGGVREVTVCSNQGSQMIRRYFMNGGQFGMNVDYYEDSIPRGPAGCVLDAVGKRKNTIYVVTEGTLIPRISVEKLIESHVQSRACLTVVVESDQGVGKERCSFWSPVGIYVFDRQALKYIREKGYQDIKEGLIPQLYAKGENVATYVAEELCFRVTDPESYLRANEWALGQIGRHHKAVAQYRRRDESFIHVSARVAETVKLIGPVLIGVGTVLEGNLTIVGPTSIGSDCVVEEGSTISRSVIWDRCRIGSKSFVDQCIVTNDVRVGSKMSVCRIAQVRTRQKVRSSLSRLFRTIRSRREQNPVLAGVGDCRLMYSAVNHTPLSALHKELVPKPTNA